MSQDWELAILRSDSQYGGCASNRRVYDAIPKFVPLTKDHLKRQWGDHPAFQNQVRSHISNLCDKGELQKIRSGYHCLTEKGKARLSN